MFNPRRSGHWEIRIVDARGVVLGVTLTAVDPGVVEAKVTHHPPPVLPPERPSDPSVGDFWDDPSLPSWRHVLLREETGYSATHVWNGRDWLSLVSPDYPDSLPDDRHSVIGERDL